MRAKVISNFYASINTVTFNKEDVYDSCYFILEKLESKFGEVYNQRFIEKLKNVIETMYLKYEDFNFAQLESDFCDCIEKAQNFHDIKFLYAGSDWKISSFNEEIKTNLFLEKDPCDMKFFEELIEMQYTDENWAKICSNSITKGYLKQAILKYNEMLDSPDFMEEEGISYPKIDPIMGSRLLLCLDSTFDEKMPHEALAIGIEAEIFDILKEQMRGHRKELPNDKYMRKYLRDVEHIEDEKFDNKQVSEIYKGFMNGINAHQYAQKEYDHEQMKEYRLFFEAGLSTSLFFHEKNLSANQIRSFRNIVTEMFANLSQESQIEDSFKLER